MNDARRSALTRASGLLSEACDLIDEVRSAEQDWIDSLPDTTSTDDIDEFESVVNDIEDVSTSIGGLITDIDRIIDDSKGS